MAVSAWDKHSFAKNVAECIRSLPAKTQMLVVAHAALESGWGTTTQARRAFNIFNLSAGSSWHGPTMAGGDLEYSADGKVTKITQQWRCYGSFQEAVDDYLHLLQLPRYLPAHAALMDGDGPRFVEWLGPDRSHQVPPVGGFYTLPTASYLRGFHAVLAEVAALIDEPPAKEPRL